jgi:hypothetical protein
MKIDYLYSQLSNEELSELLTQRQQEAEEEAKKERERMRKVRNFRFSGGLL